MKEVIDLSHEDTNKPGKNGSVKFDPPQVLVLGFAALIICGAIMLSLPQATVKDGGLPLLDAIFTAASAVCVTGLTVVDTGTTFTVFGQVVILVLIQIGGIGFMTFASLLAIIMGKKITLKERLLLQEALSQLSLQGVVRLTKYIIKISLLIEGIAALVFAFNWSSELGWGKSLYFGIFHAASGFNNAGFDLFGNYSSLTSYTADYITNITMMLLIITGGLGFTVLSDLYSHQGKRLTLHSKMVIQTSLILIVSGTILVFLLEHTNPATLAGLDSSNKILASLFQAVTARTAGFNTIDTSGLCNSTHILLLLLMFIGASPGSTGGGIKTTTFASIVLYLKCTFRGNNQVSYENRAISQEVIRRAVIIVFSAFALILMIVFILSITENSDFMTLLFETVSAFGTVGLSMGITPYLTGIGKAAIILTMFCGRVGPLTLVFALSQNKNKSNGTNHIKLPEERITIG